MKKHSLCKEIESHFKEIEDVKKNKMDILSLKNTTAKIKSHSGLDKNQNGENR